MHKDLLALEEQGWEALSTPGDAGKRFYDAVLSDSVVMLFLGGLRLEGKSEVLSSISAQAWSSYRIEEATVIPLAEQAGILAYKATAHHRHGEPPYVALISSTYVRADRDWRLVFHQHTPV